MDTRTSTPSTSKVRRDVTGGKRADGHLRTEPVRRPDPRLIRTRPTEQPLTAVAGLVPFGRFLRDIGLDAELCQRFAALKDSPNVVYPMAAQMRLLIDAITVGGDRVFDIEALAADPLFVHLAGGVVPSLDTVYRDLCRFDDEAIERLEALVAEQGLARIRDTKPSTVHLDIDSTVTPLFGEQQGARVGPNPRYHGRPSYHPILARLAETGTFVGAMLRPGDTGFGGAEAPLIVKWIDRVREAVGPDCALYVRIDGACDCAELLDAITARGAIVVTKAGVTPDLCGLLSTIKRWTTVERGADNEALQQVTEVPFARRGWDEHNLDLRVLAVRTVDPANGKPCYLWPELDASAQVFITNDWGEDPIDVMRRYNLRAGIEPMIGEVKYGWGLGKMPSQCFSANHAALLLKLLAFNVMRRYLATHHPDLQAWRVPWLRRALLRVPGRLSRSGRKLTLHVPARSRLARLLN
jgi:Transposase DDE domain group 1